MNDITGGIYKVDFFVAVTRKNRSRYQQKKRPRYRIGDV